MEETIINGTTTLINYGAIGVISLFSMGSTIWIARYLLKNQSKTIEELKQENKELHERILKLSIDNAETNRSDSLENVKAIININQTLKNIQNEQYKRGIR